MPEDVALAGDPAAAPSAPREHWRTRQKRLREEAQARGEAPTDTETHGSEVGGVAEGGVYMDPKDFFGPVLAALLASGRCEARNLDAFARQAWADYKRLVDWARNEGR